MSCRTIVLNVSAVLFFGFGIFATTQAQAGEIKNPVKNSSFEQTDGDGPAKWFKSNYSGKGTFELADTGRTGSRCVMLSSEEGADISWSQVVSVEPFGRYRLSGWIKTEDLDRNTGSGALLNIHDIQSVRTNSLTGTNDWAKVQCEFRTMGSTSIHINCLFGGWGRAKGKAWFDDIKLQMLEKVVPVSKTVEAEVTVNTNKTSEPISKYIYGQFIEHLGRCIYGGIWAEMLEDRKFYFPVPAKGNIFRRTGAQARVLAASPWKVIGPEGTIKMVTDNPYVGEHTPEITPPGNRTAAGIYQEELGLIKAKQYVGRVIISGNSKVAPVTVSLVWGDGASGREDFIIKKLSGKYVKVPFRFTAGKTTDNGRLEISSKGKGAFRIGGVSFMPADNIKGFRKDTLQLLRELNSPVYRWPGGNFVSGYDWRDGLGDRDKRPTRTNPAWTGIETNDVGIDEFVELCRLIDTEPMIAVNTGFSDAYSAAAEVEYANGAENTQMGKIRAKNGHRRPYNIKWWCVGNEMFGSWQLGYMQLSHYVLKHNWIEEKMRQVDPAIKTVGVGAVGDWTKGMLTNCADNMDLLSEHFYCQNRGDLVAHVAQIPNNVKRIADAHREYRRTIPALEGKDIRIALDEWNYWYGPHLYGELGTRYFHKDALGIARGLHEYFRNSDLYFMANYAQTVNVIGCIKTTKTQAGFATTALPLILYRKQFGTIPVEVEGSTDKLDVTAAWTKDKKILTIAAVNATWDKYILTLNIDDATPKPKAGTWTIVSDNPLAYNDPGEEPNVAIRKTDEVDITEPIKLAPMSITLFRVSASN